MTLEISTGMASEGGHWYGRDGSCVYEMRSANGTMRPVTLRDARKHGWVPGFSSIAKMEYKPQLERWKIEQAYLSCLTLPRVDGETLEDFKKRAYQDSTAQSDKARDRGTYLHSIMEGYFTGYPIAATDLPFVWPAIEWLQQHYGETWSTEKSFAHPYGYGGKVDLNNALAVVDFKFKDFDDVTKTLAYDEHAMQLFAYDKGLGGPARQKVNLFISSTAPGIFVPHVWEENEKHWDAFVCLLKLWQIRKNYCSSFSLEQVAA